MTQKEAVEFYLSEVLRMDEVRRDPEKAAKLHRVLDPLAFKDALEWAKGTRLGSILRNFRRHGWSWSERESAFRMMLSGLDEFARQEGRQKMVGPVDGREPWMVLRKWRTERFGR